MIFWVSKPNALFQEVLNRTFDMALDEIRESIKLFGPQENNTFFNDEIVYMFGGMKKLNEHLIFLKEISESDTVYQISDYSYLLLHRMLDNFCSIYNDIIAISDQHEKYGIVYRKRLIRELDMSFFLMFTSMIRILILIRMFIIDLINQSRKVKDSAPRPIA